MIFKYKPTKFKTHGRLLQSPRRKIRLPRKSQKFSTSAFAYRSLVRA